MRCGHFQSVRLDMKQLCFALFSLNPARLSPYCPPPLKTLQCPDGEAGHQWRA